MNLDNRIYTLQKTELPDGLSKKLVLADRMFLNNQEEEARKIIDNIEQQCRSNSIPLADINSSDNLWT